MYNATIEVDDETIRAVTGNNADSLRQLVQDEFGWLESSGIILTNLTIH